MSDFRLSGSIRQSPAEETLERILPLLDGFGITRCADITGLDTIGIPVSCAVRPDGRLLQVAGGKGATNTEATVSALMEAIELTHAEQPRRPFTYASETELAARGLRHVRPELLNGYDQSVWYSPRQPIAWIQGTDLISDEAVWLPASAAYCVSPTLYRWTSNGLASGNTDSEAVLHGTYELIERHALATLVDGDSIDLSNAGVIKTEAITDSGVALLVEKIADAQIELRLLRVSLDDCPIHTMLAFLVDPNPFGLISALSFGAGAHLSPAIAASRAITEAAQSRAVHIHAAREDLRESGYRDEHDDTCTIIRTLSGTVGWAEVPDESTHGHRGDYDKVIGWLSGSSFSGAYRVALTYPDLPICVNKTFIVGAQRGFPL